MLWLVGSLDLISMFCPAMTPIMCGLYMQPFWSSRTAVVGTAQFLSGRPDFTHTNAYFSVPLPFTTTVSDLAGASLCARSQAGFADISMVAILGASPVNATLPVIVPPLASSGIAAAPPAAAGALSVFAVSGALSPPHPTSVRAAASPTPIQIFFMLNQSPCLTGRTGLWPVAQSSKKTGQEACPTQFGTTLARILLSSSGVNANMYRTSKSAWSF